MYRLKFNFTRTIILQPETKCAHRDIQDPLKLVFANNLWYAHNCANIHVIYKYSHAILGGLKQRLRCHFPGARLYIPMRAFAFGRRLDDVDRVCVCVCVRVCVSNYIFLNLPERAAGRVGVGCCYALAL